MTVEVQPNLHVDNMLNSDAIKTQILLAWDFCSTRGRRIATTLH